jgi:hypothetical protein
MNRRALSARFTLVMPDHPSDQILQGPQYSTLVEAE